MLKFFDLAFAGLIFLHFTLVISPSRTPLEGWLILYGVLALVWFAISRLFAVIIRHGDEETQRILAARRLQEEAQRRANEAARTATQAAKVRAEQMQAVTVRQAQDAQISALRDRQQRLSYLEAETVNLFTDWELSRDFSGRLDPAALRIEFRRFLISRSIPDLGLLRESANLQVRAIIGDGTELPAAPPHPALILPGEPYLDA